MDRVAGGVPPEAQPSSWDAGARLAAGAGGTASQVATTSRSPWIVNRLYDGVFFIFSPLLALALGIGIAGTALTKGSFQVGGYEGSAANLFIGMFIASHLFIVFFRSHVNRSIFKLYPFRFTLVPVALLAGMVVSEWITAFAYVLAIWWDVYHSSLQTFGLGRIYDAKLRQRPHRRPPARHRPEPAHLRRPDPGRGVAHGPHRGVRCVPGGRFGVLHVDPRLRGVEPDVS